MSDVPTYRRETTPVIEFAQAVSRILDEAIGETNAWISADDDEDDRCMQEVSAELKNSSNGLSSHFWIETSEGKRFRVAVVEEPA